MKFSNLQYFSIGSDNGLAPARPQAIIWPNDGLLYGCIYVSLGLDELKSLYMTWIIEILIHNLLQRK